MKRTLSILTILALFVSASAKPEDLRLHSFAEDAGDSKTAFHSFFISEEDARKHASGDFKVHEEDFNFDYEKALKSLKRHLNGTHPENKRFKVYEYTVSWFAIRLSENHVGGFPYCFIRSEVVVPSDLTSSGREIKPGYHIVLYDGTVISNSAMEQIDFRPKLKAG